MKDTYQRIRNAISMRSLPEGANINLKDQFCAFFNCSATYYSRLLCYADLKKIDRNLHGEMIEYNPDNSESFQMDALDYMVLVKAWNYYSKTVEKAGENTFFEKYVHEKNWEEIGLSQRCAQKISDAAEKWDEEEKTHSIAYMDIESKRIYVQLLKDVLTRKKESIEDSVNALLTVHAEEQLIGLLSANEMTADINLYFQLSMIIGWLTSESSLRNVNEENDSNAYFTSICNINPKDLINSINDILEKYVLDKDKDAVKNAIEDLGLTESKRKISSNTSEQLEVYKILIPYCLKWAEQYEKTWKEIERDPIYEELSQKIK